jgi:ADP-ribose pyrophosphatase YjhB (NUDIX family)
VKKRVAAFAYAILRHPPAADEILVVRRSPNDRYFPNMWGIPAGTLRKRESYEQAIQRTARDKLSIDVEVLGQRGAGSSDRGTHVVEMCLYEVRILAGTPQIREVDPAGHGYTEVQWAKPDILDSTRERGSLCCRLVDEWMRTMIPTPGNSPNTKPGRIRLLLEAVTPAVRAGEVPRFRLTIRNEGDAPERIIDLGGGRRSDLQDNYYDLEVTQGGKRVDMPRIISDPGPVAENDFRELQPGESVTYELLRFPSMLAALRPGKYQARVRFRQDPMLPITSDRFSPEAEFTVTE